MKVAEITPTLENLWNGLDGTSKVRACLFNLVVFTPSNARKEYIEKITQKVVERFPCRIIVISLAPESKELELKAKASILTGSSGEVDIVCDSIEIDASPSSAARIPFAILPYLLPDLPVTLVWGDDPALPNETLPQVVPFAERLIFDSEASSSLPLFAKGLLAYHKKGYEVADLNWARTESWRDLLAATFNSQERLLALGHIESLKITYNSHETPFLCHTKTQAIYLQGWIASQLGWVLERFDSNTIHYQGRLVELASEARDDLPSGTVISVEITSQKGDHFSFQRGKDHPHQIMAIVCDLEKCEIPSKYIFSKSLSGLSLVNEIYHQTTHPHFLKLLTYLEGLSHDAPLC